MRQLKLALLQDKHTHTGSPMKTPPWLPLPATAAAAGKTSNSASCNTAPSGVRNDTHSRLGLGNEHVVCPMMQHLHGCVGTALHPSEKLRLSFSILRLPMWNVPTEPIYVIAYI